MEIDDRALLARLFAAAVKAADAEQALRPHLPEQPKGRLVVVGAGKAAGQMAAAFERLWGACEGVVVVPHGHAVPTRWLRVMEAGHPVPDAAGLAASEALFQAASGLGTDDLVVALISGGGSALLPAPQAPLTLEDEVAVNRALLASGAPISAMNAVRAQISRIKAGRLAAACAPARVLTLVVSDVPGDDPAQVASGPTVAGSGTRAEALTLAAHFAIPLPEPVRAFLGTASGLPPDRLPNTETRVIASARLSLEAAAAEAAAMGLPAHILSDSIEGESREVAKVHAALAREVASRNRPFSRPCLLLSGGETTVTLRAKGQGGRNTEFALALALAAEGTPFTALAADTDGVDGNSGAAGAFVTGESASRLRAQGQDPQALLASHMSAAAFAALGDLFAPGPTGTNVNDFRAVLVR